MTTDQIKHVADVRERAIERARARYAADAATINSAFGRALMRYQDAGGSITALASELGVNRVTLHRLMKGAKT